jgi:hypothetical protein
MCQFSYEDLKAAWMEFQNRYFQDHSMQDIQSLWDRYAYIRDVILLYKGLITAESFARSHKKNNFNAPPGLVS